MMDDACNVNLHFIHISKMLNLNVLVDSLVRLWAMYQAKHNRQKQSISAVLGPFHFDMTTWDMGTYREEAVEYLCNALGIFMDKQYLLLPCKPR